MRIIGLDPGSVITGYGVISVDARGQMAAIDYGCIRLPKERLSLRYAILYRAVEALLERHRPDAVAVEDQYLHPAHPRSGFIVGMTRSVVMLAATLQREIPVFAYTPAQVKKAVTGHGGASKIQVQKMVQHLLSLPALPTPPDAGDGLGLSICHAHTTRLASPTPI